MVTSTISDVGCCTVCFNRTKNNCCRTKVQKSFKFQHFDIIIVLFLTLSSSLIISANCFPQSSSDPFLRNGRQFEDQIERGDPSPQSSPPYSSGSNYSPFRTTELLNDPSHLTNSDHLINRSISEPACDIGWHRFGDKCFHFLGTSSSYTFDEAKFECSKLHGGANLASIRSEREQRFIESLLRGIVIYNNVWLGAKWLPETLESKSGYYWIDDGSPINYHNKLLSADLIKSNSSECIAMFMHSQYFGIWTPFNCNYYFHVLCERYLFDRNSSIRLMSTNQFRLMMSLSILLTFVVFNGRRHVAL